MIGIGTLGPDRRTYRAWMEGGHDDPVAKDLGDPKKAPASDLSAIMGETIPMQRNALVRVTILKEKNGQLPQN